MITEKKEDKDFIKGQKAELGCFLKQILSHALVNSEPSDSRGYSTSADGSGMVDAQMHGRLGNAESQTATITVSSVHD